MQGGKGAAAREEGAAVGVFHRFFKGAFGVGRGVGEGEDDGMVIPLAHFRQDGRIEDAAHGGEAHEDGGFDVVDDFGERLQLAALVVVAREVDLVVGELVAAVVGDQASGVDQPETSSGFVFREAFTREEFHYLLGDSDAGAACAEEHGTLLFGGEAGSFDGVDDAGEDDGAGALDVVVEAGVLVLVTLECREWILEVLELDDNAVRCQSMLRSHHTTDEKRVQVTC